MLKDVKEIPTRCPECNQPITLGVFSDRKGLKFFVGYYCCKGIVHVSKDCGKENAAEAILVDIEENRYKEAV